MVNSGSVQSILALSIVAATTSQTPAPLQSAMQVGIPGGARMKVIGAMHACAKSYPAFCNPMDCSPPGSCVHGISQARHWSRFPFPSPGDLPNLGIEPRLLHWQVDSLPLNHLGSPTACL